MICCVGKNSAMNQSNQANVPLIAESQNSISLKKKPGRPRKPPFDTATISNTTKVRETNDNRNHAITKSRVITPSNGDVYVPTAHLHQSPLSDITSSNILTFNLFNDTLICIHTFFCYVAFLMLGTLSPLNQKVATSNTIKSRAKTPSNVDRHVSTTHLQQYPLSDITSSNFINYHCINHSKIFLHTLFGLYMHVIFYKVHCLASTKT